MKLLAIIIMIALLAVAIFTASRAGKLLGGRIATANTESSVGTHAVFSLLADAAHSYDHLLIKAGSDADHGAVCGAANPPIGTTTDQPEAAEDVFNVAPLGIGECTRKVRVATALGANIDLFTAASGFAQATPAAAGTYYRVGKSAKAAVQVGSGNYLIEFIPCFPEKVVVIAQQTSATLTDSSGGTADTTIAAITNANNAGSADVTPTANAIADLAAQCNALRADIAAIHAGLGTGNIIAIATA